ncbi:DUF485 domain-containing protein [Stratiformator vulcanicus]|uniref:Inner membrane protein YjcH n=1 Tax=Stratiformator vulcanicus TaxID=2527980 RepID=A0A517R419_9PLAN|nr:DUF485 domain-containing protein [Stratiformator vulcanicus]QDT38590.1 hypothetical protein Pan189_29850 [Stratiformator vulcanicus]
MRDRNQRIGFALFAAYLLLYGGFVFLAAFAPRVMEQTPLWGLNVAIIYGFALIVAALIAALIYGFACRPEDASDAARDAANNDRSGASE